MSRFYVKVFSLEEKIFSTLVFCLPLLKWTQKLVWLLLCTSLCYSSMPTICMLSRQLSGNTGYILLISPGQCGDWWVWMMMIIMFILLLLIIILYVYLNAISIILLLLVQDWSRESSIYYIPLLFTLLLIIYIFWPNVEG